MLNEHVAALQNLRIGVEFDKQHLDDGEAKLKALDFAIEWLQEPSTFAIAVDWYERRADLKEGMVFCTATGVVLLDRPVPGDATRWYVGDWRNVRWCYYDNTVEPGDLRGVPLADHALSIEAAIAYMAASRKARAGKALA